MITEDYVSFETAKLLKEKGFDSEDVGCLGGFYSERCYESGHGVKTQSGQEVGVVYDDLINSELENYEYLRPTLQMAMKWLREIYDLHIIAYPWRANKEERATHWCCQVYKSFNLLVYEKYTNATPKSYEKAVEAAIKYCLENLI